PLLPPGRGYQGSPLPGVGLGSRSAGARKNLVDFLVQGGIELDLERLERARELLSGARSDDGSGDGRVGEQPRDGDVGRFVSQLSAERLVAGEIRPVLLAVALGPVVVAPSRVRAALAPGTGEQAARERTPGNHPHAVLGARRQNLELD